MSQAGFMWECSCGHVEYGEMMPEECSACYKIDGFIKIPEEIGEIGRKKKKRR